jgi:hypothetical protein
LRRGYLYRGFVKKSRNTEEVEAESVSFAVCAYYGIATGENSFGYIATWSKDKRTAGTARLSGDHQQNRVRPDYGH